MGPTWALLAPGQVGPMLAPWTLLSGIPLQTIFLFADFAKDSPIMLLSHHSLLFFYASTCFRISFSLTSNSEMLATERGDPIYILQGYVKGKLPPDALLDARITIIPDRAFTSFFNLTVRLHCKLGLRVVNVQGGVYFCEKKSSIVTHSQLKFCFNGISFLVDYSLHTDVHRKHNNFHTNMMTSSNGNIFRVTGHLCGEFPGPRWIPRTKASDAELCCFLWSAPE